MLKRVENISHLLPYALVVKGHHVRILLLDMDVQLVLDDILADGIPKPIMEVSGTEGGDEGVDHFRADIGNHLHHVVHLARIRDVRADPVHDPVGNAEFLLVKGIHLGQDQGNGLLGHSPADEFPEIVQGHHLREPLFLHRRDDDQSIIEHLRRVDDVLDGNFQVGKILVQALGRREIVRLHELLLRFLECVGRGDASPVTDGEEDAQVHPVVHRHPGDSIHDVMGPVFADQEGTDEIGEEILVLPEQDVHVQLDGTGIGKGVPHILVLGFVMIILQGELAERGAAFGSQSLEAAGTGHLGVVGGLQQILDDPGGTVIVQVRRLVPGQGGFPEIGVYKRIVQEALAETGDKIAVQVLFIILVE